MPYDINKRTVIQLTIVPNGTLVDGSRQWVIDGEVQSIEVNALDTITIPANTFAVGNHTISFTAANQECGSNTLTQTLSFTDGTTPPGYGILSVSSTPPGADIFIDNSNENTGFTPNYNLVVPAGPHVLKLTKPGYYDLIDQIEIVANQTLIRDYEIVVVTPPQQSSASGVVIAAVVALGLFGIVKLLRDVK